MAEVVEVSRLLDQRGLSSFHYKLIFWCVLLSLIDGYDIAAIAFAAPHLVRDSLQRNLQALGRADDWHRCLQETLPPQS